MSKLTNLKGRIDYISSRARQENLYAVYETTGRKFWKELAKCNQEEFIKSGSGGKCIEARELIIALPESFVDYQPNLLLKLFTEHFKQNYGTECISALHHNKSKTNYHIHLIFAERKLLDEPVEKRASRNMFYDEKGRHMRTKKEILGRNGEVRQGCRIIPKGGIYEESLFTVKDKRFKSEDFLEKIKCSYTELINLYIKSDDERLRVFDRNGVYLPMKKIGKNNPKAEQIESDNEIRKMWNQTVDRALISGVPERQIIEIKQNEIGEKARASIMRSGRQPELFKNLVMLAAMALEILITQIFRMAYAKRKDNKNEKISKDIKMEPELKMPVQSAAASQFPRLSEIYKELEGQNEAIYEREQQLNELEKELSQARGIFKSRQRKELQEQVERMQIQIESMKRYLSSIVLRYGYKSVKDFMTEYMTAKDEYRSYKTAVSEWEKNTGKEMGTEGVKAKLLQKQKEGKELENNRPRIYRGWNERCAR